MSLEVYRKGSVLVARGATWDLNPKVTKATFADKYAENEIKARRDYEAIPPESVQAALYDKEMVVRLANMSRQSPVLDTGGFADWFKGVPHFEYYGHADLSLKRDSTGISLCHYDPDTDSTVIDLMLSLKPDEEWKLSFERVFHIILTIKQLGFHIAKWTFDGWQSLSTIERLVSAGIPSETYSIDRTTEAYDTLISTLTQGKLDYYYSDIFVKEFQELQLVNGKRYDHLENGSKDLSDSAAGCVTQCVKSRMGMAMGKGAEFEKSVHYESVLPISESFAGGSIFYTLGGLAGEVPGRGKQWAIRVDSVGDDLVTVVGWHDRQQDTQFVDSYLVWTQYGRESCGFVEDFLVHVCMQVNVTGISLGEYVPLEVLHSAQRTGKPVTSPMTNRVPGQHKHIAQTSQQLAPQAVRMTLANLKRGILKVPYNLPLLKDLQYSTVDNFMSRSYLCVLAAWSDFVTREAMFGRGSKQLPGSLVGGGANVTSAGRSMPSAGGRVSGGGGGNEVDRIRQQHAYNGASGRAGDRPGGVFPKSVKG